MELAHSSPKMARFSPRMGFLGGYQLKIGRRGFAGEETLSWVLYSKMLGFVIAASYLWLQKNTDNSSKVSVVEFVYGTMTLHTVLHRV